MVSESVLFEDRLRTRSYCVGMPTGKAGVYAYITDTTRPSDR